MSIESTKPLFTAYSVAVYTTYPNHVYAATRTGVLLSGVAGATWQPSGLTDRGAYSIVADSCVLYAGTTLGAAISLDVRDIPFAVLDRDRSADSRELVEAFTASGYFRLLGDVDRPADADRMLRRGEARLILSIPPGYSRDLASGRSPVVQALVDGSDANTATIAIN